MDVRNFGKVWGLTISKISYIKTSIHSYRIILSDEIEDTNYSKEELEFIKEKNCMILSEIKLS